MRSAKTELQTAISFTLRERSYSCKAEWNSIGNSSTSNTCNPIYIAGTILQLQSTMEFHRQLIHQHHLQSHLHCGNDPTVANQNGILSTADARRTGETPFTMRNRSEHDPPMIRPHTRPSRNRRTAEVDHRGSGTDFVWKNIGFVHLLSLKNAFRARLPSKLHTYASLQQAELLAGVINEQDCRAIRTACCCLRSLRIRVEARANVTEHAVISRQLQLMQASVRLHHTEDLNTTDTSCAVQNFCRTFRW